MMLETRCEVLQKALKTADSTSSSFPSKVNTHTKPSGNGIIEFGGLAIPNAIKVLPYATAGDNDTFSVRIISWESVSDGATELWIPTVLAELACTASADVGVAGMIVTNTERFADTITLVTGNDDISIDIVSPTGDVKAHAVLDLKGARMVELTFDSTAVGTTAMNALVKFI